MGDNTSGIIAFKDISALKKERGAISEARSRIDKQEKLDEAEEWDQRRHDKLVGKSEDKRNSLSKAFRGGLKQTIE